MGPLKLEIMHRGPSCWKMGWIVGGLGVVDGWIRILQGDGGGQGVKGGGHLLGNVENGAYAAGEEGIPVAGVVL